MTPVDQRILADPARGDGHNSRGIAGDCLRASLASVMDLQYLQVPHVVHYGDGRSAQDHENDDPLAEEHGGLWWRRLRRWLRTDHDLDAACYLWEQPNGRHLELHRDRHPWSGHVILGGPSPRGPFNHVVVGHYDWIPTGRPGRLRPTVRTTHDPHPSRAGLLRVVDVTILVPLYDPTPPVELGEVAA